MLNVGAPSTLYELNQSQLLNRLRYPRFLCMDLPFNTHSDKEESKGDIAAKSDYKNILKEVIEFGSMKGNDSFTELVKNGYLVRADYDLQIASQLGKL